MNAISPEDLVEIERRIVARMVDEYEVDLSGLALDMTNFATYIDSANDRAPIAQRGKAKQKRNDLRLVGLGLVVCRDGGIPLLSHAYEGNRHDVTQFADVVGELSARFGAVAEQGELTVVFDAGQDSEENLELIAAGPLHFVGSIPPSDHLDLMAVPKSRYKVVDAERFPGLSAFEATKVVFGAESRFVVTHSQDFHDEQAGDRADAGQGPPSVERARRAPAPGSGSQVAGPGRPEVAKIVRPRWLSQVVSTSLVGTTPSELRLSSRTKPPPKPHW